MAWEPIAEAQSYHILIAEDIEFSKNIIKKTSPLPELKIDLNTGQYFYKVRAVDTTKKPGLWSEAGELLIPPLSPKLLEPEDNKKYSYYEILDAFELKWEASSEKDLEYELSIINQETKKSTEHKLKTNSFKIDKLDSGSYAWKVRIIVREKLISEYSSHKNFIIEKLKIDKAELIYPKQDEIIASNRIFSFQWQNSAATKFTDLELEKIDDKKFQNFKINNIETNEYEVQGLGPGKYRWRITTKEEQHTSGQSSDWVEFKMDSSIISKNNHSVQMHWGYMTLGHNYSGYSNGNHFNEGRDSWAMTQHYEIKWQAMKDFALSFDVQNFNDDTAIKELNINKLGVYTRLRFGTPGFQQSFITGFRQELQNAIDIYANTEQNLKVFGYILGTEMTGNINDRLKLSISVLYFKPDLDTDKFGKYSGDAYELFAELLWNPAERFWLTWRTHYSAATYFLEESNAHKVRVSQEHLSPVQLGLKFEY